MKIINLVVIVMSCISFYFYSCSSDKDNNIADDVTVLSSSEVSRIEFLIALESDNYFSVININKSKRFIIFSEKLLVESELVSSSDSTLKFKVGH